MVLHVPWSGCERLDGKLPDHDVPRRVHCALGELGDDERLGNDEASWLTEPTPLLLQGKAKLVGGKLGHHAIEGNPDHGFRGGLTFRLGGGLDWRSGRG